MPDEVLVRTAKDRVEGQGTLASLPASAPAEAESAGIRPAAALFLRAARNPLLAAAMPLLDEANRLRGLPTPPDPEGLRESLVAEVRRFEQAVSGCGITPDEIQMVRFALCATLDDVVLSTPWGPGSGWAQKGLVETVGGMSAAAECFFDILEAMLIRPRLHRRKLELFYVCLSLGFEGKFRDRPQGRHSLSLLRGNLYKFLQAAPGRTDRALAPAWRGVAAPFRPLGAALIPPWVVAALSTMALTVLFFILAGSLAEAVDPVMVRLSTVLPERPVEIARRASPPASGAGPALVARVQQALAPEILTNDVEVLPTDDGSLLVRVRGGNLFAVDSDTLRARYRAVIDRIGLTLAPTSGHVVVVGHTDDLHAHSVRFATPQALTEAQADAVRRILERHLGVGRVIGEGRGDAEPLAPNTSAANRAVNRRIDVHFYPN